MISHFNFKMNRGILCHVGQACQTKEQILLLLFQKSAGNLISNLTSDFTFSILVDTFFSKPSKLQFCSPQLTLVNCPPNCPIAINKNFLSTWAYSFQLVRSLSHKYPLHRNDAKKYRSGFSLAIFVWPTISRVRFGQFQWKKVFLKDQSVCCKEMF